MVVANKKRRMRKRLKERERRREGEGENTDETLLLNPSFLTGQVSPDVMSGKQDRDTLNDEEGEEERGRGGREIRTHK